MKETNESMKETISVWQWEKNCCLVLSIHLSHHKRAINEFDWFRTLWLNDNAIRANPPIRIVSIENRSNYPFLIECVFDQNSLWIFWSDITIEDRGLLFTAIYFWKRAAGQRTKNDFIPELGSRRWNWSYKNLNLSQGPSNSNQNRRAYSEQTARTVRTAQTSNKYRDYSDAIVDQLISICIFPNSRCRTNLIECTFPCTNQPSEMDLRVGRDETTWKREFRSPYL